jgi:hypothetical protein
MPIEGLPESLGPLTGAETVETITRRRRREAERAPDGSGWILRYTRFARRLFVIGLVLSLFCLVASTIAWLRNPTTTANLAFTFVVFGAFSALWVYAVVASRTQIFFDDAIVESRRPFRDARRLAWREVDRLSFSPTNKSITIGGHGRSIKIYLYTMDGIPKLWEYLLRHAWPAVERSGVLRDGRFLALVAPGQ